MELVDTHCHLHFKDYLPYPKKIVADAKKVGVTRLINVGTNLEDSKKAVNFANDTDGVWATVGVHPHDATNFLAQKNSQKLLKDLLAHSKVVAMGEIGLDYYHSHSPKEDQEKTLRSQIEIGLESGLPFVFHVRDALPTGRQAWNDFLRIVDDYKDIKGVAHSFSSNIATLEKVLEREFLVALNGIMTFTKDESQLTAAKAIPLSKLVIETDAPFLAPAPFRGETCEPKHTAVIAEFLADLRKEPIEEIAKATTRNAIELFNLGTPR